MVDGQAPVRPRADSIAERAHHAVTIPGRCCLAKGHAHVELPNGDGKGREWGRNSQSGHFPRGGQAACAENTDTGMFRPAVRRTGSLIVMRSAP